MMLAQDPRHTGVTRPDDARPGLRAFRKAVELARPSVQVIASNLVHRVSRATQLVRPRRRVAIVARAARLEAA